MQVYRSMELQWYKLREGQVPGIRPTNSNQFESMRQVTETKFWSLQLAFIMDCKGVSSHR